MIGSFNGNGKKWKWKREEDYIGKLRGKVELLVGLVFEENRKEIFPV